MIVNLDDREWQQVMAVLAQQPWHAVNGLLMKIGGQLQHQAAQDAAAEHQRSKHDNPPTNSGGHHAEGDSRAGSGSVGDH
jgi:hypothetical protein